VSAGRNGGEDAGHAADGQVDAERHAGTGETTQRSRREIADLHCPTCTQPFQAEVWLVIDRVERPDLVHLLLDGELNVARCPHCGTEGGVNHPLLFHDPEREDLVCAIPLSVQGAEAARELVGDLLNGLLEAIPETEHKPYLAEVEVVPELDGLRAWLIEQALESDQGVEDRLLAAALQELLNVGGQAEFERVIAEHRQLLLTDRAARALDDIFANARVAKDSELQRRAREARALLGRLRTVVAARRRTLAGLLDELAPLSEEEVEVVPALRSMLEAIDPQEVYAARIGLNNEQQKLLDELLDRIAQRAEEAREAEALAFVRTLQALPRQ